MSICPKHPQYKNWVCDQFLTFATAITCQCFKIFFFPIFSFFSCSTWSFDTTVYLADMWQTTLLLALKPCHIVETIVACAQLCAAQCTLNIHVTIVHILGLPGLVSSNKDTQHNWSLLNREFSVHSQLFWRINSVLIELLYRASWRFIILSLGKLN